MTAGTCMNRVMRREECKWAKFTVLLSQWWVRMKWWGFVRSIQIKNLSVMTFDKMIIIMLMLI